MVQSEFSSSSIATSTPGSPAPPHRGPVAAQPPAAPGSRAERAAEFQKAFVGMLRSSAAFYRDHAQDLLPTVAVVAVPMIGLVLIGDWIVSLGAGAFGLLSALGSVAFSLIVVLPLSVVGTTLLSVALTRQVAALREGRPCSAREAWAPVQARWAAFLSTSVGLGAVTFLGLALFLLPGIWIIFRTLLVGPVMALENQAGWPAIRRSSELVKSIPNRAYAAGGALFITHALGSFVADSLSSGRLSLVLGELITFALLPLPVLGFVELYRDATEGER